MKDFIYNILNRKKNFNSKEYWQKRYSVGENSGAGSYGRLAKFKAEIINEFVKKNKINLVTEFGCGDGNQLFLFKIPNYLTSPPNKVSTNFLPIDL